MTSGRRRATGTSRAGGTPAIVELQRQGIDHQVHEYTHRDGSRDFGDEVVRELATTCGFPPSAFFKTLVWLVDEKACVAVVPVPAHVSPKLLAAALRGRRAAIAEAKTAERISGSTLGAISPIGLRRRVPIVFDSSIAEHARVMVSGGRRGVEVELAAEDLVAATNGEVATIATNPFEG